MLYHTTEGMAEVCFKVQDCTWVSVVEEPSEGELVEPVVVPVDILVALRPARIICNCVLQKGEEFLQSMKSFCGYGANMKRTCLRTILVFHFHFAAAKKSLNTSRHPALVCPDQLGQSCLCPSRT